jgi:anti-anti-sigma factor
VSRTPTGRGRPAEALPFRCNVRPERHVVIVVPEGELDLAATPVVDARLSELDDAGFRHLAVDLRAVELLSSSGVELLLRWAGAAVRAGKRFSVIAGRGAARRVLELTGADGRLELVEESVLVR